MFIKRLLIKSKILESNIKEKELNNYMAEGIPLGMCLGLGIGSLIKKDNPKK